MKTGRGGEAAPFMVMDVIARANAVAQARAPGEPGILRLEVGQPGTGAPQGARRAVRAALGQAHPMGYTEALGLPSLRRNIAAHYQDWYGLAVPWGRIAVTSGASGAFPLAFLACFDAGDRIALAAPYYPPYVNVLTSLGMRPVIVPTDARTRFQPTPALLDQIVPPPDGLIVASPCNPAGTLLTPAELAALAGWCTQRQVRLISDEIYHGIQYDAPLATAASCSDSAVVVNSFSKYFSMTGWRIGWMVLPEELVRPVERLAQNMMISAPHVSQIAAEAALECHAELQANVARYRRSRDRLIAAMPRRWFAQAPQGAFYLYADLGAGADSVAFCRDQLDRHGIACAPGVDFDADRGHRFVRFSYAGDEAMIAEAAERIAGQG
jgi:aspartate/methionine/tyrosine aminotransferase